MSKTDLDTGKIVSQFWHNVEQIGLARLNHAYKPRYISINLSCYLDEVIKLGLPIAPLKILRIALRNSESPVFIECAHVRSAITGKHTRCFVFGREGQ